MTKALVLLNMGGPNNLSEVEVFLKNMFNDKNIITVKSNLLRKFIAFMITKSRKKTATSNYKQIGSKSPINELTKNLVNKLKNDIYEVTYSMRYTPPFSQQIVNELKNKNIQEVFLFPMYPHYSQTTTKSSIEDFKFQMQKQNFNAKIYTIDEFYKNQNYNNAIISLIKQQLTSEDANKYDLIFSAHSLPQKIIDNGDVYEKHINSHVQILTKLLVKENLNFNQIHLAYQSKLGPVKWLQPELETTLKTIKNKNIIIFPISFCIDNSESIFELVIEYNHMAKNLNFQNYKVAACPNSHESFIKAINQILKENNFC